MRARNVIAVAAVVVLVLGGTYSAASLAGWGKELRHVELPAVPDGFLSDVVWMNGDLYYVWEPPLPSESAPELWRLRPGGEARSIELRSSCPDASIVGLGRLQAAELVVVEECSEKYEISAFGIVAGVLRRLQSIRYEPGKRPVINRVVQVENETLVSGDGYKCTAIGVVRDSVVLPVQAPIVGGDSLNVGGAYARGGDDCRDLPMGGFVAQLGSSVVFMASTHARGVDPDNRKNEEWSAYLTDGSWGSAALLAGGFSQPVDIDVFGTCILIAATRGNVSGIWILRQIGERPQLLLEGKYGEFSVEWSSGKIAAVGSGGDSASLKLLRPSPNLSDVCR